MVKSDKDFVYPLPPVLLHQRYDCVFNGFKNELSGLLIGLPETHRSSYLKFILGYSKEFLREFISDNYYFVMIDEVLQNPDDLLKTIAFKISALPILDSQQSEELQKVLVSGDSLLCLLTLEKIISTLPTETRIVLVIYEPEKIIGTNSRSIDILSRLWHVDRHPPVNGNVLFCFVASPVFLELITSDVWSHFRGVTEENICEFPLFDDKEINYTRLRMESLLGKKYPNDVHTKALRLSGGHPVLYRTLVNMTIDDLQKIEKQKSHPQIDGLIASIWNGVSHKEKSNSNFAIPLLPPISAKEELHSLKGQIPLLTAQQHLVFDYFCQRPQQIVTRDEVAQVIWGDDWENKYSDWAIDKCMSELNKKLSGSSFSIISIRNRGYKYVSR